MKITCPHCSQNLELDPETLIALEGASHFDCPTCGGPVAVPEVRPVIVPVKQVASQQSRNATAEPAATNTAPSPMAKKRIVILTLAGLGVLAAVTAIAFLTVGRSTNEPASATKERPFENALGMKFVPVPGTNVLMCIHETRYQDYAAYAADAPADPGWKDQSAEGFTPTDKLASHPVMKVSWDDAQNFCAWLSKREGRVYRLPTDLEWSTAAGIGREKKWEPGTMPASVAAHHTTFPWGDVYPPPTGSGNYSDASRKSTAKPPANALFLDDYNDGFPTAAPVMSFRPNPLGIFDMGGNVSEWLQDWDEGRKDRNVRGGSFGDMNERVLRSSHYARFWPDKRDSYFGFRCVVELPEGYLAAEPESRLNKPRIDGLLANDEWQDILDRLDQNRMVVKGEWNRTAAGMECPTAVFGGFITMETAPLEAYEARVRYTSARHDRINVILPSPSSYFNFSMSPFRRTVGVERETRPLKKPTGGDAPHELYLFVAPDSLKVTLDGEVVYEQSPMDWEIGPKSGKYRLGLYLHAGAGTFHSFEIRIPKPAKE